MQYDFFLCNQANQSGHEHESVCFNVIDPVCQCFYTRGAKLDIGNVYPRSRHSGIGRPALYGDSVSNIESPPPVDQDNLENQSVYVRWNACRHLWADDGGVTEEPNCGEVVSIKVNHPEKLK